MNPYDQQYCMLDSNHHSNRYSQAGIEYSVQSTCQAGVASKLPKWLGVYNQLSMIRSREILESERILSNAEVEDLTEDIKSLILLRKYAELVEKGMSIPDVKHRCAVMGYGYLGLREWKNLIRVCDEGIQAEPNQPEFYSLKAKALGKLGKHHDRILMLEKAIELDTSKASYHRNLGSAYYSIGSYELAASQFDKAIELEPDNIMNHHNKGTALFKHEEYKSAMECFNKALQINPNLALTYSWMGETQKMLQNFDEAIRLYQKAYEISGKQVYSEEVEKVKKQKNLHEKKGTWGYGLAWLGSKVF